MNELAPCKISCAEAKRVVEARLMRRHVPQVELHPQSSLLAKAGGRFCIVLVIFVPCPKSAGADRVAAASDRMASSAPSVGTSELAEL